MTAQQMSSRTFAALKVRNFRLYFFGQLISVSGTWMQSVAQGWLIGGTVDPANVALNSYLDRRPRSARNWSTCRE